MPLILVRGTGRAEIHERRKIYLKSAMAREPPQAHRAKKLATDGRKDIDHTALSDRRTEQDQDRSLLSWSALEAKKHTVCCRGALRRAFLLPSLAKNYPGVWSNCRRSPPARGAIGSTAFGRKRRKRLMSRDIILRLDLCSSPRAQVSQFRQQGDHVTNGSVKPGL